MRPVLLSVTGLVASCAAECHRIRRVPLSVFRYNDCVPVMSHAAGVKVEPVKVNKMIRSEKWKDLLVKKGFQFRF